MTRFIILRHGETSWNLASRIQGHSDSPLTPAGVRQAQALAQRMQGERFDVLVSSDLGRALETARIVAGATGHAVVADPRFRERNFGDAEGLTYGELDHEFPDAFSKVRETDPDYVIPNGESRRQMFERVKSSFEALAREHPGKCVAVVSHGGVLASLYRAIHAIPVATPHHIPILNASFNVARYEAPAWTVEAWGDIAHLEVARAFEDP
jgi:probable phosphoglycerate mutase